MVTRRPRKWKSERSRVLHAIRMSKLTKTRYNWNRVDLAKHIAEDIETLEYRNKNFIVRHKVNNEKYVIEIKNASLRQLDELERFVNGGGNLIEPKVTRVEQPFKGTEVDSPMQKRKYVKRTKTVDVKVKKKVEITIERKGNYTRIVMPKSMDNDTVCLVLQ